MKYYSHIVPIVAMLIILVSAAKPQSNRPFSYEGTLRTASGSPIADGVHRIAFSFYETEVGGAAISQDTQTIVTSNGIVSTQFTITATLSTTTALYLGIAIDSQDELAPRTLLAMAPGAIYADRSSGLSGNKLIAPLFYTKLFSITGAAGGDLSGTYPSPTVSSLSGLPIATTIPKKDDQLTWNGTRWAPATAPNNDGTFCSVGSLHDAPQYFVPDKYWTPYFDPNIDSLKGFSDPSHLFFADSGWYTVPTTGYYRFYFECAAVADYATSIVIGLTVNSTLRDSLTNYFIPNSPLRYYSILKLEEGDHIKPVLNPEKINVSLYNIRFKAMRMGY